MLYRLLILATLVFAGNIQAQSSLPEEQSTPLYAGCPCRNQNKPKPILPVSFSNEEGVANAGKRLP